MNVSDLQQYFQQHQTDKVRFAFADIDGVLRGKLISVDKLLSSLDSGIGFCDVVFGWDSSDLCYDDKIKFTGWHTGYPDKLCRIDLSTFRTIPWQNQTPFFLANFGSEVYACPRNLMKTVAAEARAMGFTTRMAQEFEWFNFKESPDGFAAKGYRNPEPISQGMFGYSILRSSQQSPYYYDLFNQLSAFGVELEGLHTETGPGVYEAAISHDEALAAADKAVLFKAGVKEIASQHGIMASFMAKWSEKLPGCSGHIHQSLWDESRQKNLFYDGADRQGMSQLMRHYIAGQLYCLPHILPMYAPTVNSFKRLVEGAWAPVTLTWGFDNRTTALRVIGGSEKLTRLEMRVPGSDSNPYLAMAASLASGLYGIRHKLPLHAEATVGNGYLDTKHGRLPANLLEAATAMKNSTVANQLFGEAFVQHFAETRLWEWKQFATHVSDWEMKRYFEII